jgi:lysophospholipase L1-like esterase
MRIRVRIRSACAGALLLLASTLVPSSASALEPRAPRPAVWVVGDSVTVYAAGALRSRLSSTVEGRIEIDAEIGRNVDLLDDLVRQQLARTDRPRAMVLALGTNPDAGWTLSDYRRVVDSIPDSITVVLVTVFRSRGTVPASVLHQLDDYSRWMRSIARTRDNVCVAPWRGRVSGRGEHYLLDGVHPNRRGSRLLADVVAEAVAQCSD